MKSEPCTGWNRSRPSAPLLKPLTPLVQALTDYDRLQRRRFHVPAHAGQSFVLPGSEVLNDPYRYDLTELDGLDVLSEPSGCILEAQASIAELFRVSHSYMLVNGASVGLMAALLSVIKPGDKVLLPRNAHRSVLSALILTGAEPVWFLPPRLPGWGLWGGINAPQIQPLLDEYPDIRAVLLTSPTYEGLGSHIQDLAALCRARNMYLIVDEAHGSLWPLTDTLPPSASHTGADAVIHSLHKSGGSLTQSALAHLPYGSQIAPDVFQQALNTLQTTSPSYLLMASLDATCGFLASEEGQARIHQLLEQTQHLRQQLQGNLQSFRLFEPDSGQIPYWDPCKLYLTHPSQAGEDWGAHLEQEQQLAYESASPYGVLYLANLGLEKTDFEAFVSILLSADLEAAQLPSPPIPLQQQLEQQNPAAWLPQIALLPRDAFFAPGCRISADAAIGRIAKETIVHCPPGIPVLMPGERIQPAHLPFLPKEGVLVLA